MITPAVAVSIVFLSSMTFTLAEVSDADIIDLLVPPDGGSTGTRRCSVELDKANIPCDDAYYVQFKNGTRAIQFNLASDASPVVALFGTESAANKLSIENVFLRLGDQSAPESEMEATGACILSEQEIRCDVKTSDGRQIDGHIFPP